jgi:hypothetical protein
MLGPLARDEADATGGGMEQNRVSGFDAMLFHRRKSRR